MQQEVKADAKARKESGLDALEAEAGQGEEGWGAKATAFVARLTPAPVRAEVSETWGRLEGCAACHPTTPAAATTAFAPAPAASTTSISTTTASSTPFVPCQIR